MNRTGCKQDVYEIDVKVCRRGVSYMGVYWRSQNLWKDWQPILPNKSKSEEACHTSKTKRYHCSSDSNSLLISSLCFLLLFFYYFCWSVFSAYLLLLLICYFCSFIIAAAITNSTMSRMALSDVAYTVISADASALYTWAPCDQIDMFPKHASSLEAFGL